ncbi:polysaccharide deacetylase family protein [Acidobacteriota bacterium]
MPDTQSMSSGDKTEVKQLQPEYRSRCTDLVHTLLEKMDQHQTRATFFVTGKTHKYFPELVKAINEAGHEIGFHAFSHIRLDSLEILEEEFSLSREFLDEYSPVGFRAPWINLKKDMLPLLKRNGFIYDSSTIAPPGRIYNCEGMQVFPISCLFYFQKEMDEPLYPHQPKIAKIYRELPLGIGMMVSILRGFYNRILHHYSRQNTSIIFYLHLQQLQWLDEKLSLRDGIRYIHNFSLWPLIERLLSQHRIRRLDELVGGSATDKSMGTPHYLTFDMEF